MSTQSPGNRQVSAVLADRFALSADGALLAHSIVATLASIDAVLAPVIGKSGVAALFKRSFFLCASTHPWLSSLCGQADDDPDFAALTTALGQQDSQEAAAAGTAIVHSFCELLSSMVGASLSDRLLRPLLVEPAGRPPLETPSNE